jgi:hypothetical protein
MLLQRGRIGPNLEKDEARRIFAVNLDAVMQTAGLGARAMHMLKADASQILEYGGVRDQIARHDDHARAPLFVARFNRG